MLKCVESARQKDVNDVMLGLPQSQEKLRKMTKVIKNQEI